MPATPAENSCPGATEQPNNTFAIFDLLRELARVYIIAQYIDFAISIVFESKGPRRTITISDKMGWRDGYITLGFIRSAVEDPISPTNEQVIIVAH